MALADTDSDRAAWIDEIHERTPHLHIPRDLPIGEGLRRVIDSARLSVAGRHSEALAVCVAAPPDTSPPLSQG